MIEIKKPKGANWEEGTPKTEQKGERTRGSDQGQPGQQDGKKNQKKKAGAHQSQAGQQDGKKQVKP